MFEWSEWAQFASSAFANIWVQSALVFVGVILATFGVKYVSSSALKRAVDDSENLYDDRAQQHLELPVIVSLFIGGLYVAASLLELPDVVEFISTGVLVTLLVVLWGWRLMRLIDDFFSLGREDVEWLDDQTTPLIANVTKGFVFALGAYFFFLAWDIDLTAWLASAGIIGIAVGFASKDILSNLFGGIFILIDSPYKEGDYIHLDSGERGRVERIGLRSTRLVTPADVQVTVPNSRIATAEVFNESMGPTQKEREISTTVGVQYGADIDAVTDLIGNALDEVEHINPDGDMVIHLKQFGEESLLLTVACRLTAPEHEEECLDQINRAIYQALSDDVLGPAI